MNQDAEREIKRICRIPSDIDGYPIPVVSDVMRAAMRWAYVDAAKVCKECSDVIGEHRTGYIIRAIEARAK